MNRGSFSSSSTSTTPTEPDLLVIPKRARPSQMASHREARTSRASVLPAAVFPYLRRIDTGESIHRDPLLVFQLSSQSFLDSQVQDDRSRLPLYTITTNGTQTTVVRSDPWNGDSKTAVIQWPVLDPSKGKGKQLDGVSIQMRSGRRKPADTFLRPASILSAPRKFKIPGYSHSLKWKAVGSSYWCIAASAKGPIAILEPAVETAPPRLKVFETLHDKYDVRPMMVHQGVSILLLDYLLVSALLLATDIQEWMVVQRYEEGEDPNSALTAPEVSGTEDSGPKSAPPASTSALQWRKIIYGEPLFPKRQSSASTATHATRMAKIMRGEPIFPTLRRPSSSNTDFFESSSESESEEEQEEEEEEEEEATEVLDADVIAHSTPAPPPPRVPSPSAESVLYPLTPSSAPSHTYLDPSYYYGVPPVPPLPAEYAALKSPVNSAVRPTSASGPRRPRELPRPPAPHSQSHRSRSSPPRPTPIQTRSISPIEPQSATYSPERRRPSIDSMLTRSDSLRTLPMPPPTEASSSHPPLRHSQTSTRPLNIRAREKRSSQYTQRTLPPTPTALSNPEWMTALRIQKRSHSDLSHWYHSEQPAGPYDHDDHRQSIYEAFDGPPPAYNSLEFAAGTSLTLSDSSSPPPPPPPLLPPPISSLPVAEY
jgi:hypothetical protein